MAITKEIREAIEGPQKRDSYINGLCESSFYAVNAAAYKQKISYNTPLSFSTHHPPPFVGRHFPNKKYTSNFSRLHLYDCGFQGGS